MSTTSPSWRARCMPRSPVAGGARRLVSIDAAALRALPGVVAVLTAADIPGPNDCGPIVHGDDPILAEGSVHYLGQPMFAVIAADRLVARRVAARAREFVTSSRCGVVDRARGPCGQSLRGAAMHLARGDAAAALPPHAPACEFAVDRWPGAVLTSKARFLRDRARRRRHAGALLDATPERDAAGDRARARPVGAPCAGAVRRMGGGFGGKESQSRCSPASPRWLHAGWAGPSSCAGPR